MYKIPAISSFKELFCVFSTKDDSNMANTILGKVHDFEKVRNNRRKFLKTNGVDINNSVCMWVQHEDQVIEADEKLKGISMTDYNFTAKVDGLITNKKNFYLFVLVADCIPLILFERKKQAIGLIHISWLGADKEIAVKAVKRLAKKYNSDPEDIVAIFGPCARKDSFIKENPSQVRSEKWKDFLEKVGDKEYKVDIPGLVKRQLTGSGILTKNIIDCGIDTVKDQRFFSHMREKNQPLEKQGRFCCLVGLK